MPSSPSAQTAPTVTLNQSAVNTAVCDNEPILLRVEDAAKRFSIGKSTMYTLINTGKIPTVMIISGKRIPLAALYEYVAARTRYAEVLH